MVACFASWFVKVHKSQTSGLFPKESGEPARLPLKMAAVEEEVVAAKDIGMMG